MDWECLPARGTRTHNTTDEMWAELLATCAGSVVEFMTQQVVMKWERQGKRGAGIGAK